YVAKGDPARALPIYRRALEIREKALGPEVGYTLETKVQIALALASLGKCDEARPILTAVTPALEKSVGATHPFVAAGLRLTARCELEQGRAVPALEHLERTFAIYEKTKVDPADRGNARWLMARALWAVGRHADAISAAGKAEQELAGDADGTRERAAAQ